MTAPGFELTSQRQKVSRLPTEPPGMMFPPDYGTTGTACMCSVFSVLENHQQTTTLMVNNGVVYLDYEDSTSPWSSVLVSMIVLDSSLLFDDVLFCLRCLSGVPAWRLM